MKLHVFRMEKAKTLKGPPRPGMIPVRVFIAATSRATGHMKTVYKKVESRSTPGVVTGLSEEGFHEVPGRGFHAIVYIKEEDYPKFFVIAEGPQIEARMEAERGLYNMSNLPEEDLSQVGLDIGPKAEAWVENVVHGYKGIIGIIPQMNKLEDQNDDARKRHLKSLIGQATRKFMENQLQASKRHYRAVRGLNSKGVVVDEDGKKVRRPSELEDYLSDYGVDLLYKEGPRSGSPKPRKQVYSELVRKLGLFDLSQIIEPRQGEADNDAVARLDRIVVAARRILTWHITKALHEHLPESKNYLPSYGHPFEREEEAGKTLLPETARGEYFSLSRKVAEGSLRAPVRVHKITRPDGSEFVKSARVDEDLYGKPLGKGKRYLNKAEWDTLIAEIMGSRVAMFEEDKHTMKVAAVPLKTSVASPQAKSVWTHGVADLICANAMSYVAGPSPTKKKAPKRGFLDKRNIQRLMGAGYEGTLYGLATYDPESGVNHPDFTDDPALALMAHVGEEAEARISLSATHIFGEKVGEERQALMSLEKLYGGSWRRFRIVAHALSEATRINAVRGVFREPTRDEVVAAAESQRYTIEKYIPPDERGPDAWQKFIEHHLTEGIHTVTYAEEVSEGETQAIRPAVVSPAQIFRDAMMFSRLEDGYRPKTMGNVGASDQRIHKWERDDQGNIVRGFRDPKTGLIAPDKSRERLLMDPWERRYDSSGHPVMDPRYGDNIKRDAKGKPIQRTDVFVEYRGRTTLSPHQVEKYEMLAKLRHELFNALNDPTGRQEFKFTPLHARALDVYLFRGLALDPNIDYSEHAKGVKGLAEEIGRLKGEIEAHPKVVQKTKFHMLTSGVDRRKVTSYVAEQRRNLKAKQEKLKELSSRYDTIDTEIRYPKAAPPSYATPGMKSYPGIPVDADGSVNRKMLRAVVNIDGEEVRLGNLSDDIIDTLGQDARADAAFHLALAMELDRPEYNGYINSVTNTEEHSNPDLRKITKVRKFSVGKRQVGGRDVPWGEEPWVYRAGPTGGKAVPLYSLVNDNNFNDAYTVLKRVLDIVDSRNYFGTKGSTAGTLPTYRVMEALKNGDTPTVAYDKKSGKLIVGSSQPYVEYHKKEGKLRVTPGAGARKITSKEALSASEVQKLRDQGKYVSPSSAPPVRLWLESETPGVNVGPPVGLAGIRVEAEGQEKEKAERKARRRKKKYKTAFEEWQTRTHEAQSIRAVESRFGPGVIGRGQRGARGSRGRSRRKERSMRVPTVHVFVEGPKAELTSIRMKEAKAAEQGQQPPGMSMNEISRRQEAILRELPSNTQAGKEYSKFLADLNITLSAMWDTKSVLYDEAQAQSQRALAATDEAHEVIAQSRGEMRPPMLRTLAAGQAIAVVQNLMKSGQGQQAMLDTGKYEKRQRVIAPLPTNEAFQKETVKVKDKSGKERSVTRFKRDEEGRLVPVPGVETVERKKRSVVTPGSLYGRYKGPETEVVPYKLQEVVSPVVEKTASVPVEAPPTDAEHWAMKKLSDDPVSNPGVIPALSSPTSRDGAAKMPSRPRDSVYLQPIRDKATRDRVKADILAAAKDNPELLELLQTKTASIVEAAIKARIHEATRGGEKEYRPERKTAQSPITPEERSKLAELAEARRKPLPPSGEGEERKPRIRPRRKVRKVAEPPSYKQDLTVAGKPKFAFSYTPVHVFTSEINSRGTNVEKV